MDEKEVCSRLYEYFKEGSQNRLSGRSNKHPGNSLAHMLSSFGWVQEDLRQALMKADPRYGEEQRRFDSAGLFE